MIDETVDEIAEMETHSSSIVAVKAARALETVTHREFPSVDEYVRTVERNSKALCRANPSHASLQTTQRNIREAITDADMDSLDGAKARTREVIADSVDRVETAKQRAAERAADTLTDGDVLLTHDYSSTVLETIERATDRGMTLEVYCTEARPRYLGRKMARTLGDMDNVTAHLTVDSASGHYLPDCDYVLTGMDCIVDDRLYNRVGTYPIAVTAADVSVPMRVVGAASKIVEGGFAFENEYRANAEVMREPAETFSVENPAYDATPTRLIDAAITDERTVEF
jgi:translation initiation factor 2B subunit (eIF-2B alpha/beta/delta family)